MPDCLDSRIRRAPEKCRIDVRAPCAWQQCEHWCLLSNAEDFALQCGQTVCTAVVVVVVVVVVGVGVVVVVVIVVVVRVVLLLLYRCIDIDVCCNSSSQSYNFIFSSLIVNYQYRNQITNF